MAEVVAAALTSHAPLVTGRPDVSNPEQRALTSSSCS